MKKQILVLLLLLTLFIPKSYADYTDEEEVCYAQCGTYKFIWQGDYCYDLFQQNCAIGKGKTIKDTIKFLKGIYDVLKSGKKMDTVFKAWFVCKPLIENCIAPRLQDCRSTCSMENLHYAADLSVGHPFSSFNYRGVVYNEKDKTLTFKVINVGKAYAWDIGTSASWGDTDIRDGQVSSQQQLFSEVIPELIYMGARNGPPKTIGDYIGDFLIEESNFAKYLQFLKSDADNYNVPNIWFKTIPFEAPQGRLTKVFFKVDPGNLIKEYNENNNLFVLTIDKLPTPPSFKIENFTQQLAQGSLNEFLIDFEVKNSGEESGEATVKIFEGSYKNDSQTPIWQNTKQISGLNKTILGTLINPSFKEDDYCGLSKYYELVVFDNGKKVDSWQFSLPLYAGSIRGNVKDLFGKYVKDAVISLSNGQSTTTNKYGGYEIKGINQLGKVTVTASHPEFSKIETQEIEFKMGTDLNPCDEGSLTFGGINFVLKDQDVMFNITIKDRSGNLINAHVLASNKDWRFSENINGTGPLPGMQPGKYFFTITAEGYKTIGQDVNAVPNNQNLEFTMEKLSGRLTDGGLNTHQPQLLWQFNRGEDVIAQTTATKDGKLVIIYTVNMRDTNYNSSGKLWFIDSLTGSNIKTVNTVNAGTHQAHSCLDTSYDGNTTALYLKKHGNFSKFNNYLKLFDGSGRQFKHQEINPHSAGECDVSPDGFYVYPYRLMNKGMYLYTRFDIKDVSESEAPMTYPGLLHFTTANNIVAHCPQGNGQCLQSLNQTTIANLGEIYGDARTIDSSQDQKSVVIITVHKAYLFRNGAKAWEKDVITHGDPLSLSVSPGGQFAIYSTNVEEKYGRIFKIFTANNIDKTVGNIRRNEDVLFVHANDKGLFYLAQDGKTIRYYKVGSYTLDYNPSATPVDTSGQEFTYNISYYENGVWHGLGQTSFYQLMPGRIYMANQTLNLKLMEPVGNLTILDGTLFGVDNYRNPVLLKGQMTANFNSPIKIFAIKFDRFDMNLFSRKLADFTSGNLAESEYFKISNIHTKFRVSNYENRLNVAVEKGEVEVLGKNVKESVKTGRQITIDKDNKIRQSIYLEWKIYLIVGGIIISVFFALLYKYRKTKTGKKIIEILKRISKFTITVLLAILKKTIKLIWNGFKTLFTHARKRLKK